MTDEEDEIAVALQRAAARVRRIRRRKTLAMAASTTIGVVAISGTCGLLFWIGGNSALGRLAGVISLVVGIGVAYAVFRGLDPHDVDEDG